MTGQPEFTGILHYTNRIPTGELLEDRILFVFKFINNLGNLIRQTEEADNIWMTEEEIEKLDKKFTGFDYFFEKLRSGKFFFIEKVHEVEGI